MKHIKKNSNVKVVDSGKLYTSHTTLACEMGHPDAVVNYPSIFNPISDKIVDGVLGKVLAVKNPFGFFGSYSDKVCIVITNDGFKFLIGINGLQLCGKD